MGCPMKRKSKKLRRLKADFKFFAENVLKIKTKSGKVSPLILNKAQIYITERLDSQLNETGKVRAIILKGRQQGASTMIGGRFYWKTTQKVGIRTYILTHEEKATTNLFNMVKRYYEHTPPQIKVPTQASNAKELIFSIDSDYQLGTAGSKGTGRGSTIQLFHGSEVAFWPHADEHMAGIMQALPDEAETESILESTANGVGGKFYEMWQDASNGVGEYIAIFCPWFWQDEYAKIVPEEFKRTKEERLLVKLHNLSDKQLQWRRIKVHELGLSLFKQEYPCTPEEAFLFSGRPVFEADHTNAAKAECFTETYRADIDSSSINQRKDGLLRVWDEPKPGKRYVIGADVAEGLITGDYSCADVLQLPEGYQVAQWRGHVDPDRFGDLLAKLGKKYNNSLVGVERNNHGLTTLTTLRKTGYSNIYAQVDLENRGENKETKRFGWLTTAKSKAKIIDQLKAELRDGDHGICCIDTIKELETYIIEDNGSYNAKPGCFDDRVMSRAIAGEMVLHAPKPKIHKTSSTQNYH